MKASRYLLVLISSLTLAGCVSVGTTGTPRGPSATVTAWPQTDAVLVGADGPLTAQQIREVAAVLQKRVAALGVHGARTSPRTDGVALSLPLAQADAVKLLDLLSQSGTLAFRPVLAEQQQTVPTGGATRGTVPPGLAKSFLGLNCLKPSSAVLPIPTGPGDPVVACDAGGPQTRSARYALAGAVVSGADVAHAEAAPAVQSGGWSVDLTFDARGAAAFAKVTQELAAKGDPGNQLAVVASGKVVSAPVISSAIPGGAAQISGDLSREQAQALAADISYGAVPPLGYRLVGPQG